VVFKKYIYNGIYNHSKQSFAVFKVFYWVKSFQNTLHYVQTSVKITCTKTMWHEIWV